MIQGPQENRNASDLTTVQFTVRQLGGGERREVGVKKLEFPNKSLKDGLFVKVTRYKDVSSVSVDFRLC